jgi:hypothetical protein
MPAPAAVAEAYPSTGLLCRAEKFAAMGDGEDARGRPGAIGEPGSAKALGRDFDGVSKHQQILRKERVLRVD